MQSIRGTVTQYTAGIDQLATLDKSPAEVAAIHDSAVARQAYAAKVSAVVASLNAGTIDPIEASAILEGI